MFSCGCWQTVWIEWIRLQVSYICGLVKNVAAPVPISTHLCMLWYWFYTSRPLKSILNPDPTRQWIICWNLEILLFLSTWGKPFKFLQRHCMLNGINKVNTHCRTWRNFHRIYIYTYMYTVMLKLWGKVICMVTLWWLLWHISVRVPN